MDIFLNLFVIGVAYYLLKQGQFVTTNYYRGIYVGIALNILGALFRIQHYPGAAILIALGSLTIAISYFLYFIKRRTDKLLTFIKFLFVLFTVSSRFMIIHHWPYAALLFYCSVVLLFGLLIHHLMNKEKLY